MYKLDIFLLNQGDFNTNLILKTTRYASNLLLTNSLTVKAVEYLGKKTICIGDRGFEMYSTSITFKIPSNFFKNKVIYYVSRGIKLNSKINRFLIKKI